MQEFYERYIAPPENIAPENRIFSPEHLFISTILIVFILMGLHIQIKRKDQVFSRKMVVILAGVMLGLEIFRISWLTFYYGFDLRNIRFDWCNQVCLVLPIIVLLGAKRFYPYIDVLAFMGGAAVLIYPLWVFYDYGGVHIMSVQSMISHGLMVLIALSLPFSSDYRPKAHKAYKPMTGFVIIAVIAFIMSYTLNVNYLLMMSADGIPILGSMPFPWYWIIAAPILFSLIFLVTRTLESFDRRVLGDVKAAEHVYKFEH